VNNPFYICDQYQLPIYGTREDAVISAAATVETIGKRIGVVRFSLPREPIFVIKKDHNLWHVIIGETVGWILLPIKWDILKPLELSNE
jgi:hypothetical protein